jgi:hypothetical protein
MDIVSILGLGAIGLGFLLAYLAYRLLAKNQIRERPLYIFMAFCLVLVGVGAALQFADSRTKASLEATRSALDDARAQNKRMADSMKAIVDALTPTEKPLQEVNRHVTDGGACSGGRSGEPLPHGNEDGGKVSLALQGIATASNIAAQYLPKQ